MGEIKVLRLADAGEEAPVLVAVGVGSCIGVCAYDRFARVAGMAHVVLPESGGNGGSGEAPGKYADIAIPALLQEMARHGAVARRIVTAVAGGAQLFQFSGAAPRLDIGGRNAEAVLHALREHRAPPAAEDLGGRSGRTIRLYVEDGLVHVKRLSGGEQNLAVLGTVGSTKAKAA